MGEVARGVFDEKSIDRTATALLAAGILETVPAGEIWKLSRLELIFVSSAVGGNRIIELQIRDASDNIRYKIVIARTVVASQTETYLLAFWAEGAAVERILDEPIVLHTGWDIFIDDTANIDAAGDTVETHITAENVI